LKTIDKNEINVVVGFIGYKNRTILINRNKNADCDLCKDKDLGKIFLIKNPIQLKDLYVHSHADQSNQISDIIISDSELEQNFKTNIASTLTNYSNIGINSFGSATSKPALRGFSGDRFLLTKDGREIGDLSQSSIDHIIALDMSEVNSIEVIRGPKALVFGPNTIGGVVNTGLIGDPKVRVDKIYQRYFFGGESYNNGVYGNLGFYIPFYNNQINLFVSEKNNQNETNPLGELYNTESNTINFKVRFTNYNKNGFISYSVENFDMIYGIPPNPDVGHTNGVDILLNKKTEEFSFHRHLSMNLFDHLDIKYGFTEYIHLELINNQNNKDDVFEVFNSGAFHVGLAKNTKNVQIELSSNNSILGLELIKKDFSAYEKYEVPDTDELLSSIYGFQKINFSGFDFLSSFRFGYLQLDPNSDTVDYFYLNPEDVIKKTFQTGSLSFGVIKIINKFQLNSWIMHTMRAPRVEELYSDGPHLGTYAYEIGNPNLEVEKIYGIENSVSFNSTDFYDNAFKLSLTSFYNESPYYYQMAKMGDCPAESDWDPYAGVNHPCAGADFIAWGQGGSSGFGYLYKYNSKSSEAIIKGLEFNLEYQLRMIQIKYDFSLVDGQDKTLGRPLSYMNPTKQILSFDFNREKTNYMLRLSKIHSQNRLGEFERYTPGAILTDFIVSVTFKKHNITFQFNNIFDKKYYNHLSRIKNVVPEPGFNINLNYKIIL
ncbi:MAG: TonB-dependent receptor, partial [Pelagibacteraceae bacterium TMED124]